MPIHCQLPGLRLTLSLALVLLAASSCSSRRQARIEAPSSAEATPSPGRQASGVEPGTSPSQVSSPPAEPAPTNLDPPSFPVPQARVAPAPAADDAGGSALLDRLRQLFAQAAEALETGRLEEASDLSQQLEEGIKGTQEASLLAEEFEELADDITILNQVIRDEIDYLEGEAEDNLSGGEAESHEPSPLDEIGDLNLFQISIPAELEDQVGEDLKNSRFDIPIELNELVLKSLEYFQGRGRSVMEKGLQRSGRYADLFREIFTREGLPTDMIYMAHVESLFSPRAYSRARARGIWQFMSGTARLYGLNIDWWVDERSNVEKSTLAAARHLKDLYEEFQSWELTLAAYNAGPGRIRRVFKRYGQMDFWTMVQRRLLPRETRNHIPSVLAAIIIFKNPQRYGFEVQPDPPLEYDSVRLDYQIDLRVVAEALDVEEGEISDLNPFLRRGITPEVEGGFELRVPLGTGAFLEGELAKIPPDKRLRVRHHSVQRGDTVWDIARKYGTSVRAITEVNRLSNANRLRLGQDLIIPLSDWRAMVATHDEEAVEPAPRGGRYLVRRGDSLYKIARRHGVTISQLARWNNLKPSDTIYPGQRLLISAQQ